MAKSFGIVIGCCPADQVLVDGVIASAHLFYGKDIPVCIIADGKVPHSRWTRLSTVSFLDVNSAINPFLKKNSFGWGFNKLISFWEAPFETFLYVDADALLWGDLRPRLDFESFDVVTSWARACHPEDQVSFHWFDVERMRVWDAEFKALAHPYFCAGVLAGRRGCLDLDEYVRLLETRKREPDFFKFGDQGITNYLIFKGMETGKLRVGHDPYQVIVHEHSQKDFQTRYNIKKMNSVSVEESCVLHWAGFTKPFRSNVDYSPELMTHFRKSYAREVLNQNPMHIEARLLVEDWCSWDYPNLKTKWKRRWKKYVGLL